MKVTHLGCLACPACRRTLRLQRVQGSEPDIVDEGLLTCDSCRKEFPITGGIPRFVPVENYASSFGLEWTLHARTQYDGYSGKPVSETRFFEETGWPRRLEGQTVLEAGCGSGRFTEQAAKTGALVVSFDYSYSVEANFEINGQRDNVLIVQADITAPPFPPAFFDKVFCFGVLQHTPDPRRSFLSLVPHVKPGGKLVADVYKEGFHRRLHWTYFVRPFTRGRDPEKVYAFSHRWVDTVWPIASLVRRIPVVGHSLNWRLLMPDYSHYGFDRQMVKEWAYLNCFDALGPTYDLPQSKRSLREWCATAGLLNVVVKNGYNGLEAHGTAPRNRTAPVSS